MSLLELVTKAAANPKTLTAPSTYPIILNPEDSLLSLNPNVENPDPNSLVVPVSGFQISQTDSEIIDSANKFFKKLKRKLKNPNSFNTDDLIGILSSFLEKNGKKVDVSVGVDPSSEGYTRVLIEKLGFLMGRDVSELVLEACLVLGNWELVETLIVNGHVAHSSYSNLVSVLVEKRRSDLVCLCIKHFTDLGSSELLCILKYFLLPPRGAYSSMVAVRKDWESQAKLAIEKASNKDLKGKKSHVAKEAAVLLVIAHDEFLASELCLHYLLSSPNLDDVIFPYSISKLNGEEIMSLIRYLGKWLKKYERFPQAGPCPKASSMLGLKACDSVPTLEAVVKCFGLVLNEHFSSLVLNLEFHEELRSMKAVVTSLALEARLCCSVANVVEDLRAEAESA
ncbi:uncharacterized protein LOC117934386 [Vitis riparia]|uniref:uncharacterized protein LOC117934386 n=1 Tax=Vitis riparia TaxID=96939 RepID=UPI00155AB43A|nr:uncharacterized protein LOC117934386 [Vitis riparia]